MSTDRRPEPLLQRPTDREATGVATACAAGRARPWPGAGALAGPLAIVLLAAATAAAALTTDREQPAEIDAGYFKDDPDTGQRIFRNGVTIVQGSLVIEADEAIISVDAQGEVTRVELSGSPATWEEDLDDGTRLEAEAREIDYELSNEAVLLVGGVVIDRDVDRITGERIRYDLATSRIEAGGGEGRVRMRITPASAGQDDKADGDGP